MQTFQDWQPVVFDKRNRQNKESKEEYIKRMARNGTYNNILTITKDNTNKALNTQINQVSNLKKIESEEETFKHSKVSLSMSKKISQIRCEKKLSQKDLAFKLNLPVKIIQEYENGQAIPNHMIINKLEKILEVNLRK